jgi:DNA-binding NarL/FixJ family response regulator
MTLETLTARQREVYDLVAKGHTVREVASELEIGPRTVEFHIVRIAKILGLGSNPMRAIMIHSTQRTLSL